VTHLARKKAEEHENAERWLLTYADLITLLLGLFVILYSMSKMDAERFREFSSALQGVFAGGTGVMQGGAGMAPLEMALPSAGEKTEQKEMEELAEQVQQTLEQVGLYPAPQTSLEERGLVIRFAGNVLFDSGKAELRPEARRALVALEPLLARAGRPLRVEGHTDNVPINTPLFPSNWELSATRAATVTRFLVEQGIDPTNISALGYGEYRPIAPNDTDANRQLNRRVDIAVLSAHGDEAESPKH